MPSHPIPPEAVPFVPKSNALEWRGFGSRKLCTHTCNLHGEFYPLATDGERAIVETLSGQILLTQFSAILFPKQAGTVMSLRKKPDPNTKAKRALAKVGLTEEQINELLNV